MAVQPMLTDALVGEAFRALLVFARLGRSIDVEELGAVEADALRAVIHGENGLGGQLDVGLLHRAGDVENRLGFHVGQIGS